MGGFELGGESADGGLGGKICQQQGDARIAAMALDLLQSSLPASRVAADQHDAGAHLGQPQGRGFANAGTGAGDQAGFAFH